MRMQLRQQHARVLLTRGLCMAVCVIAVIRAVSGETAADDSLRDDTKSCELRHASPAKNVQPLKFCNWYRHKSCYLPAHDAEIKGYFLALIEAGETCAKYQNHDTICSPNSAIAPECIWPGCDDQQYICQNQTTSEWYCSETKCGDGQTPVGFMDAPCNATEQTCTGVHMFVNDQRAAKPVQYETCAVEIVDETLCMTQYNNATKCNCLRAPVSGCTRNQHLDIVLLVMVLVLITAFGTV
ncbi:hypothetical protein FI667_g3426, partial [Globisporangium splendens]